MTNLIKRDTLTIGADPELFVFDKETQQFKSSIGMIGAGKHDPRMMSPGFFAQEDNVLVEFNIPPSKNRNDFVFNIEAGKFQIKKLIGPKYDLLPKASAFLTMDELQHPDAWQFGCTPDNNAWKKGKYNKKPDVPEDGLRTAGGHIHFGFEANEAELNKLDLPLIEFNVELIKLCDLYLGVPSIIMDTDKERRKLYGKAGAFRNKHYGVEYRVLSPFWLENKTKIAWAYDQSIRAIEQASEGNFISKADGEEIEYTINNASEDSAMELIDRFSLTLV